MESYAKEVGLPESYFRPQASPNQPEPYDIRQGMGGSNPQDLANMLMQYQRQQEIQARLFAGGSTDKGLLSGGGSLNFDIPITDNLRISPFIGGGGAIGSVDTPSGKQNIKGWKNNFGINANYSF